MCIILLLLVMILPNLVLLYQPVVPPCIMYHCTCFLSIYIYIFFIFILHSIILQLMNQLLMQLIMKPIIEIDPAPFAGTAVENILNLLESVNGIATHNVWNDQK